MYCFTAASDSHIVAVQKILPGSRIVSAPRFPSARMACIRDRTAYHRKAGTNRHDRNRRRVIDTTGTSAV